MRKDMSKNIPFIWGVLGFLFALSIYTVYHLIRPGHYNLFWHMLIILFSLLSTYMGIRMKRIIDFAYTDPLTGLHNRRYFYGILESELKKLSRSKTCLSLAIIDIDHFKKVNDHFGHLAGDKLLKRMAEIFKNSCRGIDAIARWGGEEFAILLPDTDSAGAVICAERIRQAVETSEKKYSATVCIGIATIDKPVFMDELIVEADRALYKAKIERNKVVAIDFPLFEST